MTKREERKLARKQEAQAVKMYVRGATLREIKLRTTVPGWIVRGLVVAHAMRYVR